MSRKKIFGALFVVAVLVLAVLSSTVRSKVSLADERKYEELPQQENIYLSANKEQPQDAIEYQPMDSIELSSELELSPLGLPSDFSQEEIEIYKTVLQDFYGFSMAFTPCNSFERALMIGAQCSDLLRKPENTKHLINDNLIFLPSLRYHDDVNPFSDGNWLHRFFTMRFVYWDSQKILGLVIDNPEANGLGEFFDHSIYFQNSTDQDYDIDVWPTSCPWFSEIVANHSSITVQGLLKKERWNGTTAKDMEENFLYYVRSDIYGDVYSGLCLNNWLYGEEDRTFRRFSMAALQSTEDLMMAERLARSMCREIEKPIS